MLTEYEWSILRAVDRGDSVEWGAAFGQALEVLRGHGYVDWTRTTAIGCKALVEHEGERHG